MLIICRMDTGQESYAFFITIYIEKEKNKITIKDKYLGVG